MSGNRFDSLAYSAGMRVAAMAAVGLAVGLLVAASGRAVASGQSPPPRPAAGAAGRRSAGHPRRGSEQGLLARLERRLAEVAPATLKHRVVVGVQRSFAETVNAYIERKLAEE